MRSRYKQLGQHFLKSPRLAKRIVQWAGVSPSDLVVEIGGGEGILTEALAERARRVVTIEIDPRLSEILKKRFQRVSNVTIHEADALEVRFLDFAQPDEIPYKIVGNLPYAITSPLLFRLFDQWDAIGGLTIMVQKEVADRLCAKPGTKDYGILSVWAQLYARVERCGKVGRENFSPPPEVDSAVIRFEPSGVRLSTEAKARWDRLLRAAFGKRRKILSNAFNTLPLPPHRLRALFARSGIEPRSRAEALRVEDFARLIAVWKELESSIEP